ncbi:MAG: hypothetical protein J5I93_14175 [Pirellulaceae bacterium]|nr:hypothetical protein [Pirellulaceae bacterium]
MAHSSELILFVAAVVIQVLGLASAVFARLSERWVRRASWYPLFYCALLAVGGMTLLAVAVGHGIWISCGMTLAIMAVGATFDGGMRRQPAY